MGFLPSVPYNLATPSQALSIACDLVWATEVHVEGESFSKHFAVAHCKREGFEELSSWLGAQERRCGASIVNKNSGEVGDKLKGFAHIP